jgi:hypothetical protein
MYDISQKKTHILDFLGLSQEKHPLFENFGEVPKTGAEKYTLFPRKWERSNGPLCIPNWATEVMTYMYLADRRPTRHNSYCQWYL